MNNRNNINNKEWKVGYIKKLEEKIKFTKQLLGNTLNEKLSIQFKKDTQEQQKQLKALAVFYFEELFKMNQQLIKTKNQI